MASFIVHNLNQVTERMKKEMALIESKIGKKVPFQDYVAVSMGAIIERAKKERVISYEDQCLIGGMLGYMLHDAYCESRKLDKPNENGLPNNPREKKLTDPMDAEFVQAVLDGKIPQSETLYIKDGVVCMDIANTNFVNLSPYWQKDNFMAGKTAARSVITCWDGLTHENPEVQKYVTIAVANGIHEAWISRDNIYYDEYQGQIYTNQQLDTAYIYLPDDEKDKDLEHMIMAKSVIGKLCKSLTQAKEATATEVKTDGPQTSGPETDAPKADVPKADEPKPETPETGAPESGEPAGSQPGE